MLRRCLIALLLVTPALGQEEPRPRPFHLTEPFRPGEVWTPRLKASVAEPSPVEAIAEEPVTGAAV